MLKKQIVVTALTLLSGTLCIAVPGQTREQRALAALGGLRLQVEKALANYSGGSTSVKAKEDAAQALIALTHLSPTYKQQLTESLSTFKACDKNNLSEWAECADGLDDLLEKAQKATDPKNEADLKAIFEYHPGFFAELSDAIDTPPAWVADTLNESRGARIAVFYTLAGYGTYKLYNFLKRNYEEHEHEREMIELPAIVVVEP